MSSLDCTEGESTRVLLEEIFDDLFTLAKIILKRNVPGKENDPEAILKMVSELNKERQYIFSYSGGPFDVDDKDSPITPI